MRLDAMHHFTAALPQCTLDDACEKEMLLGETTKSAIWNGAYWGVMHEINGYINRYSKEYEDLRIVVTGGLFTLLEEFIDKLSTNNSQLIHEPMLVPIGLNFIANYTSN